MSIKRIGAAMAIASALVFPLAACGSSTPPAPVATTTFKPLSPDFQKSYCGINSSTKTACEQHDTAVQQQQYAAHPTSKDDGLPWWAWLLIVPVGLAVLAFLAIKVMEWNDERRVAKAWAKVDELDARAARRATRVLDYDDYDDYEEDDEDDELDELDELPEEDMAFLQRATDPAPAPATPAPTAGGGLLSSLRQQGGGVQ